MAQDITGSHGGLVHSNRQNPSESSNTLSATPDFHAYVTPVNAAVLLACGVKLQGYNTQSPSPQKIGVVLPKSWTVTGWQSGYKYLLDQKRRQRGFMMSAGGDGVLLVEMNRWFTPTAGSGYDFNKVSQVTVQLKNGNGQVVHTAQSAPLLIDNGAVSVGVGWSDANKQLQTWLDKHYPDWKNPAAYWD